MKLTKTLVVGVDGSHTSTAAVCWAADEAMRRDSKLKLVHVWQHSSGYIVPTRDIVADAERVLHDAVEIAAERGAQVDAILVEGCTVDMLVEESETADLLVLGSYGQGRLADIFLGAISRGCIRHATCPIVVIPTAMTVKVATPTASAADAGDIPNLAQLSLSVY